MTIFIAIIVGLVILILGYFFVLGQMSKSGTAPGLVEEKLTSCPASPNCICSEYSNDQAHYVAPVDITGMPMETVELKIKDAVQSLGGVLQVERDGYLAYTFTSAIFRYVDDVEIRFDADNNALHLRSASRVGYSDLNANKQRIESIKRAFNNK